MAQRGFPAPKVVTIDKAGPIPIVEVSVGMAQHGTYEAAIWPLHGNPRLIGRGSTIDHLPDSHRIVQTRRLLQQINRFIVTVVITVSAVSRAPGAQWSWDLVLSQGGSDLASDGAQGRVTRALFSVRRAYKINLI